MSVAQTYAGGPPDVRSANCTTGCTLCKPYHRTYVGPPDVRYFLVNPLDNTWTYETPFGPMCTDHRTYARVVGRPLLCQGVGEGFSL
jgi:hypothetical protein